MPNRSQMSSSYCSDILLSPDGGRKYIRTRKPTSNAGKFGGVRSSVVRHPWPTQSPFPPLCPFPVMCICNIGDRRCYLSPFIYVCPNSNEYACLIDQSPFISSFSHLQCYRPSISERKHKKCYIGQELYSGPVGPFSL